MPESFEIDAASGSYSVNIGKNILADRLAACQQDIFIVDARLVERINNPQIAIIPVSASEQSKSLDEISPLIEQMREKGANRSSRIVAVGGGVIQDIATLVASLYMRGIPWEYLPTTLLGMVDSCIGGKSSINVKNYKNIVGNIYPPEQINIDVDFLKTLGPEQIIDGLCEAIKICYAKSAEDLERYLRAVPDLATGLQNIESVIVQCLKAKQWFIEIDEFDQKERLLLNFGHTFGHALEPATEFRITHGVAIGIGMVVAEEYARRQSLLSSKGEAHSARLTDHIEMLLKVLPQLAGEFASLDFDLVMANFANDKKHHSDQYRLIIPKGDGALQIIGIPRTEQSRTEIKKAYRDAAARLLKIF